MASAPDCSTGETLFEVEETFDGALVLEVGVCGVLLMGLMFVCVLVALAVPRAGAVEGVLLSSSFWSTLLGIGTVDCVEVTLRAGFRGSGGLAPRLVCCFFSCAKAESGLHLLQIRPALLVDGQQSAQRNSPHLRQ